jgi:hypothetical protein
MEKIRARLCQKTTCIYNKQSKCSKRFIEVWVRANGSVDCSDYRMK